MPDKEWEKTQRGQTQKKLDNLRYKWRKRGFDVNIAKKPFHDKYIRATTCKVCGKPLGKDRVVLVGELVSGENTITLEQVYVVHWQCQKEYMKVCVPLKKAAEGDL